MPPESDPKDVQIARYHVDLVEKRCVVEFRVRNPETGAYEPPIGYARHSLPLNADIVATIDGDVSALLARDLAELPAPVLRTHAVTSELHHLRELRHEKAEALRETSEARARAQEHGAAAERAIIEKANAEAFVGDLAKEARQLELRVSALRAEASALETSKSKGRG